MGKKIVFRDYEEGDEYGIVELFDLVFKTGPWKDLEYSHLDHWYWRYLDNPLGLLCIVVAEHKGNIIAASHIMFRQLKLGENIIIHSTGSGSAVHPDFRKQGIFNKLKEKQEHVLEKLSISYREGVSTNPILMKRNIRYKKTRLPHNLIELLKTNNIQNHLKQIRSSKGQYLLDKMQKITQTKDFPTNNNFTIEKMNGFDSRFDKFWENLTPRYTRIISRKSEYLNWRYADKRGGNYETFAAFEGNDLQGFIVLRTRKIDEEYPPRGGYIVDLITLNDRLDVANHLINHALMIFMKNNIEDVRYWGIRGNPYTDLLISKGFATSRNLMIMLHKHTSVGIDLLRESSPEKIHVVYGDFDHI
jgi:hypothetical protein